MLQETLQKLFDRDLQKLKLELQQNTLENSSSSSSATVTDGNDSVIQPVKSKTKKIKKYEQRIRRTTKRCGSQASKETNV